MVRMERARRRGDERPRVFVMLAVAVVAACVLPSVAAAQVNAEVLRPNPYRPGWSGGVDGSLALSRGNIDLLDVGGAGRVQYQSLFPDPPAQPPGQPLTQLPTQTPGQLPFIRQRAFLTASGRYAERGASPYISQAFVHARWIGMWHRRIGSDLFAQYQYNQFLRLSARAVAGAGLRVEIVHHPVVQAWAGSGYMFEYDRISVLPGAPDAPETLEHRWTNYVTVRLALLDTRLLLQNTVYAQPRLDAFTDVRILEELEALVKASDLFALGATLGVLYDSAPPTGVVSTDVRLVSTVRLSF